MPIGGGFGRRLETDFVEQALIISKAIKKPVQILWSREEDINTAIIIREVRVVFK